MTVSPTARQVEALLLLHRLGLTVAETVISTPRTHTERGVQ